MKRPDIVKKARETSIQKYGTNVGEYFKSKSIEARVLSSVNHLEDTRKQQYFDREWMDNFYTNQMNNINQVAAYFDVKRDVIIGQLTRLDIGIINHKTSQAETEIATFISNLGFEVVQNDRSVISPKEIDIYIPSLNIGIEYHGCYWHSEDTGHDNGRHLEKLSSCSSKGIRLIQIWEDDYINRKDVVLKFLLNVLGLNTSKVNARETKVVSLDQAAYSQFLDQWHMQGSHQTASIRIGLMIQDELVSVMGFKPKPSNVNKYGPGVGYELVRFASIGARGAFSKLLKWFERERNPDFIYSFADLEIVNDINNVYIKQGFEYHSSLNPDYSYYNKTTGMREHKFNWRKQKFQSLGLDIEGKTEQQLSVEYGLRRCWDSGKVCYIKRKSLH